MNYPENLLIDDKRYTLTALTVEMPFDKWKASDGHNWQERVSHYIEREWKTTHEIIGLHRYNRLPVHFTGEFLTVLDYVKLEYNGKGSVVGLFYVPKVDR